jgi:hypothetical protein
VVGVEKAPPLVGLEALLAEPEQVISVVSRTGAWVKEVAEARRVLLGRKRYAQLFRQESAR